VTTGPRPAQPRLTRNVARGIHRIEHAHANCYLLEDDDPVEGVTIVDAAFPATWNVLPRALEAVGRSIGDVKAVVLTHAHFDHLGFARRIRDDYDVPVFGHPDDAYIAEHPYRYTHELPRSIYPLQYPAIVPVLARMIGAGALGVRGITDLRTLTPGTKVNVPGQPMVIATPGHTFGHVALAMPERDVVFTGDALLTFNPYTADRGPQVVSGAATANIARAFASLTAIADTGARVLLPGHGEPWFGGAAEAVEQARRAGPS
jgi:glyoxylase-like metal-dependent hydrolase (beta-lactamase superfamily II)